MANIDRRASEQFGIPSVVLMENAAFALTEALVTHFPEADTVAIFCGPGQNGGDGFALARHLENRRITPLVFVLGSPEKYKGDALTNLEICRRLGLPLYEIPDSDSLDQAMVRASEADLVVDALFGTGLSRAAEGVFAEAIRAMLSIRLPVLAVDLPSGLRGDSADVVEPCMHADVTVTFAQPKIPHVFEPAASRCGEIIVADITIPEAAVEAEGVTLSLIRPEEVQAVFPPRELDTHKGTYGHTVIISGSAGKSGAAVLCARGAVRTGSGLVSVVTDPRTADVVDSTSIESMTFHCDMDTGSIERVVDFVTGKDAVLIGPGLPDEAESYEFIRELVSRIELPMVLDATAINAFQGQPETLRTGAASRVLTPHPGELSRLLGKSTGEIAGDRVGAARAAAERSGCVVLLKGHQSVVANPDGIVVVNPTGNPGMASGGMGDVLGGIVVALMARGFDGFEAARAGVYLHGMAGDLVRDEKSDMGITAMDLAEKIPYAIRALRELE